MISKIKGTRDYYGVESIKLEKTISILEEVAKKYSLNKITTPTFEFTELFLKSVGDKTDVVSKEMYSFNDKKNRSISLKPEGTASTVRLVIENKILDSNMYEDLFYISPMFRYERPQKGRQREFFQFGVERFGKKSSYTDVETIMIAIEILNKMKISKYELHINSIGNSEDRERYNNDLRNFVKSKFDLLSDYAKDKYNTGNILRVFDSKIDSDLECLKEAPSIIEYINKESKDKFLKIQNILNKLNINFILNKNLVRGLDYYNDIVFEFISTDIEKLGSKSTIIGGGRYDSLINKFDNKKDIPSIGFAIGLERLMLAAEDFLNENLEENIDYFILTSYDEDLINLSAINISNKLRSKGFKVMVDFTNRKFSKKLNFSEKFNVKNLVIIGNEINDGNIKIKNIKENVTKLKRIEEI